MDSIPLLNPDTLIRRISAISVTVPDAYRQGYFGVVGGGLTLQSRTRITNEFWDPDGNASASFGLGNPEKYIGLELRVNIYGLGNKIGAPDNLGEGTFDIHISRLLVEDVWIGAGVYNLIGWDLEPPNRLVSYYVVGSKGILFNHDAKAFSRMYVSFGIGNGRFRADEDYSILDQAPINFFGSMAVQVMPEGNFIAEWNGYNMFSGLSLLPIKQWPIQIVVGIDDIFQKNRKLVVGGALTFHMFRDEVSGRSLYSPFSMLAPPPVQTSRVY